jgi:hypothetical protein
MKNQDLPTGDKELRVSHGICPETGKTITLEKTTNPLSIGAKFNTSTNEWYLEND